MVLGDKHSLGMIGYMYYYGLGVEKNFKLAHETFLKGIKRNIATSYNGLGLMHLRGDYVNEGKKDLIRAYQLFKSKLNPLKIILGSADLGDSSGQFNLASISIYSFHDEIYSDTKEALKIMNLAAHQGHIGAMYALAVTHIEGEDHYNNCHLSNKLMSAVIQRGNHSKIITSASDYYYDNFISQSAMLYLYAAYLGHDDALINSAVLFDRYKIIGEDKSIKKVLEESTLINSVASLLGLNLLKLRELVLGDLNKIALDFDTIEELGSKNLDFSYNNITSGEYKGEDINYFVGSRILEIGTKFKINYAFVRLGDYYYYGKHPDGENMREAFGKYLVN